MRYGARMRMGWVFGLLLVAAACKSDSGDDTDADTMRFAAFEVCTQFVTDQLRSPATAEFRNFFEDDGEVNVADSGGSYTVRSSVDSENGFGALIRNDFTCVVRPSGGEEWRLEDLTFEE